MTPTCPRPPRHRANRAAFTLIEVMVTVAIIAIMAALLTPAVRGLMGVAGPRGGVNSLAGTLEQARLAAMQSGVPTYVGFPLTLRSDEEATFSSFLVFREPTAEELEEDSSLQFVPLSRWIRLPTGVFLEPGNLQPLGLSVAEGQLPALATSTGLEEVRDFNVVAFDRFGKLRPGGERLEIRVGQKASPGTDFLGGQDNHYSLIIEPLTGRTRVVDVGKGIRP